MGVSLYLDLNNSKANRHPRMILRTTLLAVPVARL